MRIMIFGDTASGKSTFATKLGSATGSPVLHLDQLMEEIGRDDRATIGDRIVSEANKKTWIIEGNAFTKDPKYRIERADVVIVFDFRPTRTFINHIRRYLKLRSGKEKRAGSDSDQLNLRYFIPYIYKKFPPRKAAALHYARSINKQVVVFKNRKQAQEYLAELS